MLLAIGQTRKLHFVWKINLHYRLSPCPYQ